MLSSSVLFVGHSISDIHMRLLFHKLSRIWQTREQGGHRPVSYLYLHRLPTTPPRQQVFSALAGKSYRVALFAGLAGHVRERGMTVATPLPS